MITITKIKSNNEEKLLGEIGNKEYCITYTKEMEEKLNSLSIELEGCTDLESWQSLIYKAQKLVTDKVYTLPGSQHFAKIDNKYYLTNGNKYLLVDERAYRTLNKYYDKGLPIDKFAIFLARKSNLGLLRIPNIYNLLNDSGNVVTKVQGRVFSSFSYYSVKNNKVIVENRDTPRHYINNKMILNSESTLKNIGVYLKSLIEGVVGDVEIIIRGDLSCYINLYEDEIMADPDNKLNWTDYLNKYIDEFGTKK